MPQTDCPNGRAHLSSAPSRAVRCAALEKHVKAMQAADAASTTNVAGRAEAERTRSASVVAGRGGSQASSARLHLRARGSPLSTNGWSLRRRARAVPSTCGTRRSSRRRSSRALETAEAHASHWVAEAAAALLTRAVLSASAALAAASSAVHCPWSSCSAARAAVSSCASLSTRTTPPPPPPPPPQPPFE